MPKKHSARKVLLVIAPLVLLGCGGGNENLPPPPPPSQGQVVSPAGAAPGIGCNGVLTPDGRLSFPYGLAFDMGKATIKDTQDNSAMLQCLADFLAANKAVTKLRIEGHTDDRGDASLNRQLSQARADAVAGWMTGHGVDASRVEARGWGGAKPLAPNDSPQHMAMNRRLEFWVEQSGDSSSNASAASVTNTPASPAAAAVVPAPGAAAIPGATAPPVAAAASPVAGPTFTAGSPQPTAYAIVIGIEKYSASLPPPTGARADATRFSQLARTSLGLPADHVQTLFDEQATKGSIERALASAQISVPAGGRIYFYFSGHGAPDASGGTPYIVPTDGDPQFLDATAIPMKEVLTKLGQSKAREVLAVVDSCFSGAGGRSVLPPGARPIVRVKEEAAPAQLALFSASSGSEISGPTSSGDGGLFTQYVLQGLGTGAADVNGDGQVSLGELSQWVAPRVSREAKKANRDQNPALTVGKGLGSADSFIVEWGLASK